MAHPNGSPDTLEKHQYEVCNAFARAAVAMRDAASTAENFSNWFSRVNNLQNVPMPPPVFNGPYNFSSNYGGPQQPPQSSEVEETGKKRKASGDQEGKRKRPVKEKKEKKLKDLNAPKRPPSAYLLFQNDVRKAVKDGHPDMPYGQVLSEISKLWHGLSPEDKAACGFLQDPYVQATADSKVLYEKAKADYDAHSPTGATESATKPPSKSKTPTASSPVVANSAVKASATSDDDDESTSTSSDSSSEDDDDDDDDEKASEPAPEPPRKKSKKDAVKAPTPPPAKADKKKKKAEGKKKKSDT